VNTFSFSRRKKLILSVILPVIVSLLIIALDWIVCVDRLFHRAHLFMIHGILELFVTFLFPAAPVIYGWITKNRLLVHISRSDPDYGIYSFA